MEAIMAIGRFNILWAAAVVATMITVSPTAAARATVKGEYSQVGDPLLREIVGCEHSSRSEGVRSSAILNIGSQRKVSASLPSS
jgi:hypothetical protein